MLSSPRVWLVVIIGLIIAGVAWKLHDDGKVIKTQQKDIVVKDVTIDRQADTIKVDQKVDTVKETVNTEVGKGLAKVTEAVQKVHAKQDTAERVINQKFDVLPKTPDNTVAQAESLSETRIASAWDVYCTAAPDATECQVPAPGAPHA